MPSQSQDTSEDEHVGAEQTVSAPTLEKLYSPPLSSKEPIQRETLRSSLSRWLVYTFVFQMVFPFVAAIIYPDKIDAFLKVLTITVSPTVAILGAVMGFYYGSDPTRRSGTDLNSSALDK